MTPCSRIARWDAALQEWRPLGAGLNGEVRSLAVYGGRLYAGGSFSTAGGGVAAPGIAAWTGSAWDSVGGGVSHSGGASIFISTMTEYNGFLYAGGGFTHAGGVSSAYLARWNGASWSAVGANGTVNCMAKWVSGDQPVSHLYVGGTFTIVAGVTTANLARLNGSTWSAVGALPTSTSVTAILIRITGLSTFDVYAHLSGAAAGVYRYSSGVWNLFGDATLATALSFYGNQIVIGRSDSLLRWDGTYWRPYGNGIAGPVYTAASWNGSLYMGGSFKFANQQLVNNVARWDGSTFHPVGLGMNSTVRALTVHQGQLFATGTFTMADGQAALGTARWTGSSWQAIGGGPAVGYSLLSAPDGNLYSSGFWAGNPFVWRWTGASWQQVGSAIPTGANYLAWWNGKLYAARDYVVRLDGNTWNLISAGQSGTAGLVAYGDDLVRLWLSGGGVAAVKAWNGTSWRDLLPPTGGLVGSLHVHEGRLYASINGIVRRWNGTNWDVVAVTNNFIFGMAQHDDELLVLGAFSMAGDQVSNAWARLASCCGSADFNGDGDTGTDLDIEAFFACLGGNCCPTCGTADFNADGDTGTDLDIEAFFSVLGGGTC